MNRRIADNIYGLILISAIIIISPKTGNEIAFQDYCDIVTATNSSFLPSEIFEREKPIEVVPKTVQVKAVEKVKFTTINRGTPRGSTGEFKTYMDYRTITDRGSEQYKLQRKCTTDNHGFRRYGEYYVCAMGQYYAKEIGQKFIITFDTGESIKVMIGDFKQWRHTNPTGQYVNLPNRNIVEFIVKTNRLDKLSKQMGNVSYSDNGLMEGKIIRIEEILE